ncbi:hypothetical protein M8J77_008318 [Diaphorina citri]|nr:hypothetical protein M8J77_008318 [Diaphorina citri]
MARTLVMQMKLWQRDLWEGEEYPSSRTFENGSKSKSDLFRAAASKSNDDSQPPRRYLRKNKKKETNVMKKKKKETNVMIKRKKLKEVFGHKNIETKLCKAPLNKIPVGKQA